MKYTAANIIFCILSFFVLCFGQDNAQAEYQLLLNEARLFQKLNHVETRSAFIDSARSYAEEGDFDLATVFLEQYISQFKVDAQVTTIPATQSNSLQWALHSGVDFNRQEFEVGYIQSDSVLREELNKPYIAAELNNEWRRAESYFLQAESRLRYDKENFTFSLGGGGGIDGKNFNLRLQAGYDLDQNKLYPDFSYQEGNTRQSLLWNPATALEVQADNNFRYKKYRRPSSAVPSFYHDQFDLATNYRPSFESLWQFDYMFDLNESIRYQNNDYRDHVLSLTHNNTLWNIWRVGLKVGYDASRFTYTVSDSAISNRFGAVLAEVKSRVFFCDNISWNTEYQGKWKRYINKTEQGPDYRWQQLEMTLRSQFFTGFFVEAGYNYESRQHFIFSSAVKEYIEEQNYFGHGITFSVEYSSLNSYLISFNTVYIWRRYPDAHSDNIINLYANENILNFNLLAQIPVWKGIFFNIFASYDDDQDLDTEESNTRNSFFSAEFEYRF